MKIGLLGFGVVGRGVYDITAKRDDMQVCKVVCLEDVFLPDAEVTRDFKKVLEDDSIDTIIEAMGGLHPAYEFVRAAIEAGKNVVTSNKALVATFYDELLPLAEEKGVKFRCTAAVGGGIGWLSEVERSRRIQTIHQVGGIMIAFTHPELAAAFLQFQNFRVQFLPGRPVAAGNIAAEFQQQPHQGPVADTETQNGDLLSP